jgi:hypothetical protein
MLCISVFTNGFSQSKPAIIPTPISVIEKDGNFVINNETVVYYDSASINTKNFLVPFLQQHYKIKLKSKWYNGNSTQINLISNGIILHQNSSLLYLNLKDTNFHIDAQPALYKAILVNSTLEELVLSKEFLIAGPDNANCFRFNCSIRRLYGVRPSLNCYLTSWNTCLERIEFTNGDVVVKSGLGGCFTAETVRDIEVFRRRGIPEKFIVPGDGTSGTFIRDWICFSDITFSPAYQKFNFVGPLSTLSYCYFSIKNSIHIIY